MKDKNIDLNLWLDKTYSLNLTLSNLVDYIAHTSIWEKLDGELSFDEFEQYVLNKIFLKILKKIILN